MLAQMAVSKSALDENKQQQDMQQPLHPRVGKAQRRRALSIDYDRPLQVLERCFADEAVVADALDVKQTSVGRKANLAQFGEIFDASANFEVAGIVDGRLGSKRLSLLVILLDPGLLVIDVQGRHDAVSDDARAEPARRTADHPAVEHEAHLARPAKIEVLADHLLEEDAPGHRGIEHLGQGELGLQNGQRIAIARGAVARWKRMRQSLEPLAQQSIDPIRGKSITELLHQPRIGAGLDAIVERLEPHPALGKLALEVLVAVDAELGVVREIGAELQEERPEVLVHAIEVIMVDHRRGFHDPRIGSTGAATATSLRAHHPRLLLRLADVEHALAPVEAPQVLLRDIVLALTLGKGNEVNPFISDKLLDVADECLAHRHHRGRGGKALAAMDVKISDHRPCRLQVGHVDIQVHSIDGFELQHDMVTQYIRHRSCYAHCRLLSSTGLASHRASSSHDQGIVPAGSTGVHSLSDGGSLALGHTTRRSEAKPRLLFYVQHQLVPTFWARHGEWTLHEAALYGSSHYELPIILRW